MVTAVLCSRSQYAYVSVNVLGVCRSHMKARLIAYGWNIHESRCGRNDERKSCLKIIELENLVIPDFSAKRDSDIFRAAFRVCVCVCVCTISTVLVTDEG